MEQTVIWCDLNAEQDALEKQLGDLAFSIRGTTPTEKKVEYEQRWVNGERPVLITKAQCCGYGMNWQHCHNMIFFGLSDSYERFYQAIRRCWRFGQKEPVNVYIILSEKEMNVLDNITRKQAQMDEMQKQMTALMREVTLSEIKHTTRITTEYKPNEEMRKPSWIA